MLLLALPGRGDTTGPLADDDCRLAVFAAMDRRAVARAASAGSPGSWAPASSLSSSALVSFDPDYRQYPDGEGAGDVAAARASLRSCGEPDGFTMQVAAPPGTAAVVDALRSGLARAGITVVPVAADANPSADPDADSGAVLVVYRPSQPSVPAYFEPLVADVATPGSELDLLLRTDTAGDTGMEREQGRMLDRLLLTTLRYIPLAAQLSPSQAGGEEVDLKP